MNAREKNDEEMERKEMERKERCFGEQVAMVRDDLRSLRGNRTPDIIRGLMDSLKEEAVRLGIPWDIAQKIVIDVIYSGRQQQGGGQ